MDHWILVSLQGLLPEASLQYFHNHVFRPDAPIQILKQYLRDAADSVISAMWPLISPVLDRLVEALHNSPDLVVLGFFLLLIVLVLQLMSWVSRVMLFGARVAFRFICWAAVFAVAAFVWQRGIIATANDVADLGVRLLGYAVTVKDIWIREYRKYEAQTARSRAAPYSTKQGYPRVR
ncbi:hypothetical protein VTK73DRAFT_4702 [Phialemonium thermophilum]|uniref:Uncharacterized protein n=1 Tax=Phialemonium thermophilum TaxID=223376 RepID=A0ABR3WSN5_9PEZI